jgi:hypothetical protein
MVATALPIKDQINNLLKEELQGLCETCIHQNSCVYSIRSSKRILQCELFEIEKPDANYANGKGWGYEELIVNSHKGLCSNCLNAPHCQLPKAKGGVWHCGEYA